MKYIVVTHCGWVTGVLRVAGNWLCYLQILVRYLVVLFTDPPRFLILFLSTYNRGLVVFVDHLV